MYLKQINNIDQHVTVLLIVNKVKSGVKWLSLHSIVLTQYFIFMLIFITI